MKAEFVLTVDNYFEVAENRLEMQSRTLATTVAFSGLGIFLLGYFLLHFWPDRDPRVGLVSLMAGLFLAFAAAVLGFFPRRVKTKKSEALLRSEYERFLISGRSPFTSWRKRDSTGTSSHDFANCCICRNPLSKAPR